MLDVVLENKKNCAQIKLLVSFLHKNFTLAITFVSQNYFL